MKATAALLLEVDKPFELRKENGTFGVVDLGSLNRTYVNREPVDPSVLANGDQIQIGNFRPVFRAGPTMP